MHIRRTFTPSRRLDHGPRVRRGARFDRQRELVLLLACGGARAAADAASCVEQEPQLMAILRRHDSDRRRPRSRPRSSAYRRGRIRRHRPGASPGGASCRSHRERLGMTARCRCACRPCVSRGGRSPFPARRRRARRRSAGRRAGCASRAARGARRTGLRHARVTVGHEELSFEEKECRPSWHVAHDLPAFISACVTRWTGDSMWKGPDGNPCSGSARRPRGSRG